MSGTHHHHHESNSDKSLLVAVTINVFLTLAQVIGGIISGSLSLVADALHNLSDAASLGIALFALSLSFLTLQTASKTDTTIQSYERFDVVGVHTNN